MPALVLGSAAVDQAVMRLTDAWLSFPFLILAIGLVTILGASLTNATLAIGLGPHRPTFGRAGGPMLATQASRLSRNSEDWAQLCKLSGLLATRGRS
jgi:peptide/nickel transport system permease protein